MFDRMPKIVGVTWLASLYLTPNTQNTRGHGCKFRVPAWCVAAFNYSFFSNTIRIWNQLPDAVVIIIIVMSPSIEAFKSRLTGIPATQTSIQRHSSCFYLTLQHIFICLWNFDLSFASCTSCTSAMHDITQLWGMYIIGKENEDLGHAHFQGKLFVRPLDIPHTKLRTKFEASSSSSFRHIAL